MKFYLGTCEPSWLSRTDVPLFLSDRRMRRYKKVHKARGPWALDSGGFTQLSLDGAWTEATVRYADRAMRYQELAGNLDFACPQDWMCEPEIRKRTGKTIEQHQRLTIISYLDLKTLAPSVPWIPVLQGWKVHDYEAHYLMYEDYGIDLTSLSRVGVGTVCRRQSTREGQMIVDEVAGWGVRIHAFGFKKTGLKKCHANLASSDSMAWSFTARRQRIRLQGCTHRICQNCFEYAHKWRRETLEQLGGK